MTKVQVELEGLQVQFGDFPAVYRSFSADVQRAGVYAGELLGNTRVIRVEFGKDSGLQTVDVESVEPDSIDGLDYLDKIKDDRKARRIVVGAIKSALAAKDVQ